MNGDKIKSIDWQDIASWILVTGTNITPGESATLRYLSSVYVEQYYNSFESSCMSPHLAAPRNKVVIASKIKSLFTMLRGNKEND